MTKFVNISAAAYAVLLSKSFTGELAHMGLRNPVDGSWDIPLPDELLERIEQVRLPGETLSDIIIRAFTRKQ